MTAIRARVPHWERDRCFGDDLEKMTALIETGAFDHVGAPLFGYDG